MSDEKDLNPIRRNGTDLEIAPIWTDLTDSASFDNEQLARILAQVIEQWLGDEDSPTLH